jgi:hypothetical protein
MVASTQTPTNAFVEVADHSAAVSRLAADEEGPVNPHSFLARLKP